MRIVAFAALSHRCRQMPAQGIKHLFFKITVAAQAELLLRFRGNPLVIAGMGVVAGHTFAILIGHVNGRRILPEERLLMASRTKFLSPGLEE